MNIIKLFVASYLILSTFIEWNIIHCMEEKENSYDIGARYYEGKGVEQDKVEAAKWFQKAGEEDGHVTALFRLAVCYELGDGVDQDKAEAAKWFQKAADQGHIIAQFRTGVCYEKGEGVIQDKAEALKWFQKSADQGNVPAKQRVIKLKSELFGHSCTADHLNSSHKSNADISKTQAGTTNKKFADKGNSINNTKPITPQNHIRHPRQKNQKQDGQNTLSPEELKKAEEAARKAMDELIAEEEAELSKRKQSRGNSKKVKGKGNEGNKKEEKKEPISTKQITSLKKAVEKTSGGKPAQISTTKISAVDKVPTVTHSPQAQKQDNALYSKQKGQLRNTAQTIQAVNDNHMMASPEIQSEATNTLEKEGDKKEKEKGKNVPRKQIKSLKEETEKPLRDKPVQVSTKKTSDVDKLPPIIHSPQKQDNVPMGKQKGQASNTAQTTLVVNNNHILASPETQNEVTNTVGKEVNKKREEPREPAQAEQITGLNKPIEKPSGNKVGKVSNPKISVVDKVPTITRFSQIQKQVNASKGKQKGQQSNTGQTAQTLNNNPTLASSETQMEATNTVGKEGKEKEEKTREPVETEQITSLKETTLKQSADKHNHVSSTNISDVDKVPTIIHFPQIQKQDNTSEGKHGGQLGNTAQPTQVVNNNRILTYPEKQSKLISNVWKKKATSINSTAGTNDSEKNAVIGTNQLLQANNEPGSINNHQPKPHKQKNPTGLWNDVKGILKKKKPENENEARKEIKTKNNITTMSSPILYPTIANPTVHMNGGMGTPYFSGQIQYVHVPVPFPIHVKIPIYIPVPSSFPHVSGSTSQPWVPHTQIKYEDGKKLVTQWNDEGRGSTHIYHPDSNNVELEYSCLDTRLRHLKGVLKTHGFPTENEGQSDKTDNSSSHIIHHGGEAAKQKNEELKQEICKLEKIIQEKNLESLK